MKQPSNGSVEVSAIGQVSSGGSGAYDGGRACGFPASCNQGSKDRDRKGQGQISQFEGAGAESMGRGVEGLGRGVWHPLEALPSGANSLTPFSSVRPPHNTTQSLR